MIRWKKAAAAAAITVTAALALSSCAGGGSDTGTGSGDGTADKLTLITIAGPTSYDISKGAQWGMYSPYFEAVFDTLIHGNSAGELEPGLAESWEYNADNTELTLTLRDGATFTDGTPVDAEAVVASLEYFALGRLGR